MNQTVRQLELMHIFTRLWAGFTLVAFGVFGIIMSSVIASPGFAAPEPTIIMSLWAFVIGLALYVVGALAMASNLKSLCNILLNE